MSKRAVVFAYHDVGVRCLKVLASVVGLEIPLVVTHKDAPGENIWFGSVLETAQEMNLRCETPENPNDPEFVTELKKIRPDFIFSFYYRHMLTPEVLASAKEYGFNIHGSLLPKYRGRVPVNWAILKGERETGATLHLMTAKPDAGDIVDQMAVPILDEDVAIDVFRKVVCAAEIVLQRSLPKILSGDFPRIKNDLARGSYYGGRKKEDGRIDLTQPAEHIHNLIRAVAPPYPGAFVPVPELGEFFIYRSRLSPVVSSEEKFPVIFGRQRGYYLQTEKGRSLEILECGVGSEAPRKAEDFFNHIKVQLPWRWK